MTNEVKASNILLYQTEDGETRIEVLLQGETVWLTQLQLAELFQRDKSVISRHIRNIFEEGELLQKELLQNMQQLLRMARHTRLTITISMSSSQLVTGSNPCVAPSSVSGLPSVCANT